MTLSSNRRAMTKFFNDQQETKLFIVFQGRMDDILFSLEHQPTAKKGMVVMKRHAAELKPENMEEMLFYEEISRDPLEHISHVFQEIYLPMMKNTKNHKTWPTVVSQDVVQQFQRFSGSLSLFVGQTKGSSTLPVPDMDEINIETASEDRALIHSLESTIIDWTREIKVRLNKFKLIF